MKESFTETENFGICFWKKFYSHLLVFRLYRHFLLSQHRKSLIYGHSESNHKFYFTRYLLEVLCYLYWIKLVLQHCQFRMYCDHQKSFLLLLRCLMMSQTAGNTTFMAQEERKKEHWPKWHMLKSSFLNLFWNLFWKFGTFPPNALHFHQKFEKDIEVVKNLKISKCESDWGIIKKILFL